MMSTATDPTHIPELTNLVYPSIVERLVIEHELWLKAKRSGDGSAQMRDARKRMDDLLDEMLDSNLAESR